MNQKPKVTVLMAVRNGLPYLMQAIDSILNQTWNDFEFLIIDDASDDGSLNVLRAYKDERIRIIANDRQMELSRSLNLGLDAAIGKYVARMDSDDVSARTRLSEQVQFLDANPGIDVLGTSARTTGEVHQIWTYPRKDEDIRSELIFNSSLIHSSIMLRKSVFDQYKLRYSPDFKRAQDYDLWTRAAAHVRFANLQRELLYYRIHSNQVGKIQSQEQQAAAGAIRRRELQFLQITPEGNETALHNSASAWDFSAQTGGLGALELWFLKLQEANLVNRHYPVEAFGRALERRWWIACRSKAKQGFEAWRNYRQSPLSNLGSRNAIDISMFIAKGLLGEIRRYSN
jgi:glycosyltransferase involved in cell wall biosynthesis